MGGLIGAQQTNLHAVWDTDVVASLGQDLVGAAAEAGRDLVSLKRLGDRVNARTRSMGVALTSCTVPAAGRPTFQLGETEMEMGVGIHGEPGRRRVPLAPANRIAEEIVGAIAGDLGADIRGDACALIDGEAVARAEIFKPSQSTITSNPVVMSTIQDDRIPL